MSSPAVITGAYFVKPVCVRGELLTTRGVFSETIKNQSENATIAIVGRTEYRNSLLHGPASLRKGFDPAGPDSARLDTGGLGGQVSGALKRNPRPRTVRM